MKKRMRRNGLAVAGCLILASVLTVSEATIVDDVNPHDTTVDVTLSNPDTVRYVGELTIYADLGGTIAKQIVPYTIEADGSLVVTATFKDAVVSVVGVGITEEPDPT